MSLRDRIGIDLGRKISTEEGISWAVANDVRHIESQIDLHPNSLYSMPQRAAAIRDACDKHGVNLALHTLSAVNVAEISPYTSEAVDVYLERYIDVAAMVGASWVVVHAGYHFSDDYQIRLNASLARLQRVGTYAQQTGVILLLENMNREPKQAEVHYLCSTFNECQFYYQQLDTEAIRWSFTANHAHLLDEGIDGFLDRFDVTKCDEVRLADCRGHVEEHLQPGEGTIDFGLLFRRLEDGGFRGYYTNAFGTPYDMLQGRDYLVEQAKLVGIT